MIGDQVFEITSFRGGISEHGNKGPKGSFKFGYGLNIRDGEDTLKANQALKKDSSTTVTDLPLAFVIGSDGNKYAFGDTGKIYRKVSGTWSLVYTESGGRITGAVEFVSTGGTFILYATQTKLRKISLTNAGGTWSGNVSDAGTFSDGRAGTWHTMIVALGVVLINDGPYQAIYDYEDAFNATALTLSPGKLAKVLAAIDNKEWIGTEKDRTGKGWLVDWDRQQDSWLKEKPAQGGTVNAIGYLELGLILQVGDEGKLKYFNRSDSSPLKVIPGTANLYPNAITEHNTIPHFGMNGGTKNGVYSYGRFDKNDPLALNLEYVPSHGKLTGTEIGALASDGDDIYVSWKDGSTYGIDVTDQSNKADAVYESLEFNAGHPESEKFWTMVKVVTRKLPASTEVKVFYRTTRAPDDDEYDDPDEWIPTTMSDERDAIDGTGETKGIFNVEGLGENYEVRIEIYPNGNNTPEVVSANTYFAYDNNV